MPERDEKGRFVKASAAEFGRRGGLKRAERLTDAERSEIARMGLQAVADRLFAGDTTAAAQWLREVRREKEIAASGGEVVE